MKIKSLIAGMLAVVMLAGPGAMTCYAAGSSEADAASVNTASTEESEDSTAAKKDPSISTERAESDVTETKGDPDADRAAENKVEAPDEKKPYTVTVDEDGNTVYSIGDWKWSCEKPDEGASSGIVNDKVSSYLHLRSGSGMEYEIIGHLLPGEEVQVVGEDGEWYQVVVPEKTGYVSKDYLKVLEKEKKNGNIDQEFMKTMLALMMESMEDEKSSAPLTPDGNMTLVDDIGSSTGAGKQFITLVTKNGNYFYLIIDRDEDGNENVHFLNQVEEADLFALMDKDEAAALQTEKESKATEKEKAAEESAAATSSEAEEIKPEDSKPAKKSVNVLPLAVVIILLTAAGGGYFYFQAKKKKKTAQKPDPDADYEQDESDEEYELPDEDDEEDAEVAGDHDGETGESEPEEGDLNE